MESEEQDLVQGKYFPPLIDSTLVSPSNTFSSTHDFQREKKALKQSIHSSNLRTTAASPTSHSTRTRVDLDANLEEIDSVISKYTQSLKCFEKVRLPFLTKGFKRRGEKCENLSPEEIRVSDDETDTDIEVLVANAEKAKMHLVETTTILEEQIQSEKNKQIAVSKEQSLKLRENCRTKVVLMTYARIKGKVFMMNWEKMCQLADNAPNLTFAEVRIIVGTSHRKDVKQTAKRVRVAHYFVQSIRPCSQLVKVCMLKSRLIVSDVLVRLRSLRLRRNPPPTGGLRNLGNTCFMNSALNGLYSLRSFRSFFSSNKANQSSIVSSLREFCGEYTQEKVQSDVLSKFKNAIPEFNDGRQHCANSYIFKLLMLLDTLLPTPSTTTFPQDIFGNKLRQYRKGKCEPLHDIFGILAENLFICSQCSNTRRNFSYFRTVDVPIPYYKSFGEVTMFSPNSFYPGRFANVYTGTEASEMIYRQEFLERSQNLPTSTSIPTLSRTDLSQCFKYMLRVSLMSLENKMPCSKCRVETQHYEQSFFRRLSTSFVIHLQRFDEQNGTKLNIIIDFPMDLDMSDYCVNDPRRYQLCGVVYHFGSLDFGHYTACTNVRGRWYNIDDLAVREESGRPPIENAYILFYEQKFIHDAT